ncbi:hypothetical protein B0H13DRAFT_603067, partial [Mycena leptocephala]
MDHNAVTQEESETLVRVDDLWFPTDTVIVIRAENKIFRVSGGILAARSSVFRDMSSFPQPKGGDTEQMDGIPIVRLHDSADDVEVFLRAIYDSSYFMPAPASNAFSAVLGILRLSHKYDVQYLYRRALDHLAVTGWYRKSYDQPLGHHLVDSGSPSPTLALSVILTALEVGAQWLLPWAYYALSTWSGDDLLPFLQGKTGPHAVKALAAHAHLVRATLAIHRFLTIYDPCATPYSCDVARKSALSASWRKLPSRMLILYPRI